MSPKYSDHNRRPTPHELTNKIKLAQDCLDSENWRPLDAGIFSRDCNALDLCTYDEQIEALREVLALLKPDDYRGDRPPESSYLREISGLELLAFVCYYESLNRTIYIKFAFRRNYLFIVSFHESRCRD